MPCSVFIGLTDVIAGLAMGWGMVHGTWAIYLRRAALSDSVTRSPIIHRASRFAPNADEAVRGQSEGAQTTRDRG